MARLASTQRILLTFTGILYFVAVIALICPGMITSTERIAPHFVFAAGHSTDHGQGHGHNAMHTDCPDAVKHSTHMSGGLMARSGAHVSAPSGVLALTVELVAAHDVPFFVLAIGDQVRGADRFSPTGIWHALLDKPPTSLYLHTA